MAIEASARMEAAREGERLRTALIDSLTHELRTPLTSIRAAATTLDAGRGLDEAGAAGPGDDCGRRSARLDPLIGEAVEMAEIDANVVQVHAGAAASARVAGAGGGGVAQDPGRAPGYDRRGRGADEPAWFDPHLLGRVLRHLLENAARFTPPGGRIRCAAGALATGWSLAWRTTGRASMRSICRLIFEKFYRGKKGAVTGKGTGMGLAITRAILAAHGGGIEADSHAGQGSLLSLLGAAGGEGAGGQGRLSEVFFDA